ncbi:hypothetical protein TWF569_010853 [Orbilia oligospora]|nr:hypothetical protein TWF103_001296 [Orbilia oligospora]KAF3091569.1 hypothetical protein TWF706_009543 [Orbilia oligospora]KAF3098198.1 hypothetical protein TWF102_006186 [Orbilia oligospora]KAF3132571.1 hypothetical protein TWF569_010853 [Orbilia oligospora]KAF3151334.1 hypothetical protein TWF594_006984 [Orbilia oligospora]
MGPAAATKATDLATAIKAMGLAMDIKAMDPVMDIVAMGLVTAIVATDPVMAIAIAIVTAIAMDITAIVRDQVPVIHQLELAVVAAPETYAAIPNAVLALFARQTTIVEFNQWAIQV